MSRGTRMGFVVLLALLAGCSRSHYRVRAEADAHAILDDKTWCTPWVLPGDYTILPHPASRFFDPTPLDDPWLPFPAPQLYAYDLPTLPERDANRFGPDDTARRGLSHSAATRLVSQDLRPGHLAPNSDLKRLPPVQGASGRSSTLR